MKNSFVILVLIVVVAIAGITLYNRVQTDVPVQDNSTKKEVTAVKPVNADSRYHEYSKEVFEGFTDKRRVLFFYANWCPTCAPADISFRENKNRIPVDVILIRVNYNDSATDEEEKELAQKYGVTYQHTFVQLDSEGNEVTKWNGGKIDELLTRIK